MQWTIFLFLKHSRVLIDKHVIPCDTAICGIDTAGYLELFVIIDHILFLHLSINLSSLLFWF